MKAFLLAITLAFMVSGCSQVDTNAITTMREYSIDGYISIVGEKGTWDNDTFRITDYRGQKWDIPATADIREGKITLESFDRARQRITPQDIK